MSRKAPVAFLLCYWKVHKKLKEMAEPEMNENENEATDTDEKVKKKEVKKQITLDIPFNNNRRRVML